MLALQEIIFKTRPEYIIELSVAWGGQLLFFSTIMEILSGEKIIWVDIYIPDNLKDRLYSNKKLSDRIELITESSIEEENINKIKKLLEIQKMYS